MHSASAFASTDSLLGFAWDIGAAYVIVNRSFPDRLQIARHHWIVGVLRAVRGAVEVGEKQILGMNDGRTLETPTIGTRRSSRRGSALMPSTRRSEEHTSEL